MRYLKIPDYIVRSSADLYDMIFPEDQEFMPEFIIYGGTYLVPEHHPNLSFIMLRLNRHEWYNDDEGPVKFIRYA